MGTKVWQSFRNNIQAKLRMHAFRLGLLAYVRLQNNWRDNDMSLFRAAEYNEMQNPHSY